MDMKDKTIIQVKKQTSARIKKRKISERDTYDEIINREFDKINKDDK